MPDVSYYILPFFDKSTVEKNLWCKPVLLTQSNLEEDCLWYLDNFCLAQETAKNVNKKSGAHKPFRLGSTKKIDCLLLLFQE